MCIVHTRADRRLGSQLIGTRAFLYIFYDLKKSC